jgi:Tol biopolymer transport system component
VIEAGGGQPRPVHPEFAWAQGPVWSPDGNELLVYGHKDAGASDSWDWWVLPVEGGPARPTGVFPELEKQRLLTVQVGSNIEGVPLDWIDDGGNRLLFASLVGDSANLWEVPVQDNGRINGRPRRLTRGPGRHARVSHAATREGARMAFSDETLNFDIWGLPLDIEHGSAVGEPARLTHSLSPDWAPSMSEDGNHLVFISGRFENWSLQALDLKTRRERSIVSAPAQLMNARLAGDGGRIVYSNRRFDILSVPVGGGAVETLCAGCGTVTGASHDGGLVLYEPKTDEDLLVFDVAARRTRMLARRPARSVLLDGGRMSADGKWVAFHSSDNATRSTQVWIAPVDLERPVPHSEWIAISERSHLARDPGWSPAGNCLYFVSERDGFRCIWARRLDTATRRPLGDSFPVHHFHSARQSLRFLRNMGGLTGLSAGAGRLVFAVPELTGNIWLEETRRAQ